MNSLKSVSPEFAEMIATALSDSGHADIVSELERTSIHRWMYDDSLSSGYICFVPSRPVPNLIRPVAPIGTTIFLLPEQGFNIDLGRDGRLLGIEFVGHSETAEKLKAASSGRPD